MNALLARLMAQAEVNIGDFSHRAVDRAVAPLKAKSQELIDDTVSRVSAAAITLAVKAGLGLVAGAMLLVAIILALCALYDELAALFGPRDALLILAGLFLLLAIMAVVGLLLWPGAKPSHSKPVVAVVSASARQAAAQQSENARAALLAASRPPEPVRPPTASGRGATVDDPVVAPSGADQALTSGLDAVVAALGDAGFQREQAGLRAGLTLAKQLQPMQLVTLALLGGFLAGVRLPRR